MTYDEENKCIAELEDYLADNGYTRAELSFEHNDIDGALIVTSHISWGDWKHDHLYYGYLVGEWAKEKGFRVIVEDHVTDVDEEDGSDCYSGYHRCSMLRMTA